MWRLALPLVLLAAPAQAQPALAFDATAMQACLDGGHGRACIGQGAEACTRDTPGGYSTIGMAGCSAAEEAWWNDQLETAYAERLIRARANDAEAAGMTPARPSDVEAVGALRAAFEAYRDATCRLEMLQWWGGTGTSGAGADCRLRVTAEHVLYLGSGMGG